MTAPIDAARLREAITLAKVPTATLCPPISRSDLDVILTAAEAHLETLSDPAKFDVYGYRGLQLTPCETASTRDAAARIASRLIEEGCANVYVIERTP